jgi:hypothetical protein
MSLDVPSDGTGVPTNPEHLFVRNLQGWQSPPATLNLVHMDSNQVYFMLDSSIHDKHGVVAWPTNVAVINPLLLTLHDDLEKFRGVHSDYLDAIDPAELEKRIGHFRPERDWSQMADGASQTARSAWDNVAVSDELRALAESGYRLYREFFEQSEVLDSLMKDLESGSKLVIDWTEGRSGWIPNIPWGLMYRAPAPPTGEPIDPRDFLGLRYRIEHTAYASRSSSKALGSPRTAHRGHALYWRGVQGDETLAEAKRQHDRWSKVGNYRVGIAPGEAPNGRSRDLILKLLGHPEPKPTMLLYLFCQCEFDNNKRAELYFGSPIDNEPADQFLIRERELPPHVLVDEPLVFVNACRTSGGFGTSSANLLETGFFRRNCRAYLGTVNRVPIRMAGRFADTFFHFFLERPGGKPTPAGEAVAQARLLLWNEFRNIGGLFYNYVNRYDCFAAEDQELKEYRRT